MVTSQAGTGTGIDFQTQGHTTPVTAVSQVFAVFQAHHYLRNFWEFFSYFLLFYLNFYEIFKPNFQKRMILIAGDALLV